MLVPLETLEEAAHCTLVYEPSPPPPQGKCSKFSLNTESGENRGKNNPVSCNRKAFGFVLYFDFFLFVLKSVKIVCPYSASGNDL